MAIVLVLIAIATGIIVSTSAGGEKEPIICL
jgi:hypothetical protein